MVSGLHEKAKKYKIKMRKKNEEKDISKHTSHLIGIATLLSLGKVHLVKKIKCMELNVRYKTSN